MKQSVPYPAPGFDLVGTDDKRYALSDYAGQWLVLYVYPKDDTPGCTLEACSFRDAAEELLASKANVVGVSMDTPSDHEAFRSKHGLTFPLLSDPSGEAIRAYGAWGKKMFGREGILRKTFIIDPSGQVVKVYGRVTPLGHAKQVLVDLAALQT